MPDINQTLLSRVARAALATTLVPRSAAHRPPAAVPQTAPANAPITDAQAATALRQAVVSWLRVIAAAPPAARHRPDLPRAVVVAQGPVAGGGHPAHGALRNLVGELAAALAAASAGAHHRQAFETARNALLQALDVRLLASANALRDGDSDPAKPRPAATDNAWPAFSWLNHAAPARSSRTPNARGNRRRPDDGAEDEATGCESDGDDSAPCRDEEALMDIMEWLQRQPADGDYGALLRSGRREPHAGQVLNESV